jgi:hypothetical protein
LATFRGPGTEGGLTSAHAIPNKLKPVYVVFLAPGKLPATVVFFISSQDQERLHSDTYVEFFNTIHV